MIKKIECIVNVRYRERTIKSSLLTTLAKQLLFFKGCNRRKKRKCMQMSTSLQHFCNFSIKYLTTKYSGQLIENRIFIHDILESRDLFSGGYYGKPLGVSKPKNFDFDSQLVLDLIEGYFLFLKNKLVIYKPDGKLITLKEITNICKRQYTDFEVKYMVFENLRNKGYVVSPGIKFGCDFAVYIHGPGINHTPYW